MSLRAGPGPRKASAGRGARGTAVGVAPRPGRRGARQAAARGRWAAGPGSGGRGAAVPRQLSPPRPSCLRGRDTQAQGREGGPQVAQPALRGPAASDNKDKALGQVLSVQFSSVAQSCPTLATPWTAARQASLSITNSRSLFKLMSTESVMPSNHLILCRPLLLLPSIFPSIKIFSNEFALCIGWPKSIGASIPASVFPMNI